MCVKRKQTFRLLLSWTTCLDSLLSPGTKDVTLLVSPLRLQLHRHRRLYLLWLQRVNREPTNPSSAQKDIREQ
ncbi:hypothetical protein Q5P01_005678 [Channa striata]|nr:hypothetical protein Q5P01_005678 [Channa striata]